ncbi:MAG: 3-phosphoshikimate 1-carboxyvinyltransferase, partial [Ilumatobacter sp.]|nr:3-phosphoshikimate 1-carboxyvinyltransferase [Ilumatobacter sp.]
MTDLRTIPRLEGPVDATVTVPGSKSIANRVLMCAALAEGTSRISNVPDGDDTSAMVTCLTALGLDAELGGGEVTVSGVGTEWPTRPVTLFAGLAGTTSRFVTALAALGTTPVIIDGHPPLRRRPFGPLHDALRQLGVTVASAEGAGSLPATVHGPAGSGDVSMPGDVSSQFVSGLMMIGPYLPGGLRLTLTSQLVSR